MTVPIELRSDGGHSSDKRHTIVWKSNDASSDIDTNLDPWLSTFGTPSMGSVTLARIGVGAFIADRAITRNPLRQRREIELIVKVPDPDLGYCTKDSAQRLLEFVTGDYWKIEFEPDTTMVPPSTMPLASQAEEVALLSGGLDSYCGALISGTRGRLFLSHTDSSVITHSQRRAIQHIPGFDPASHTVIKLAAKGPFNSERSRRSRSVLFLALSVALADARGADTVEVPENGFTSLNPPLSANRGGVLTTRSTHPMTFVFAANVLADLGLAVKIRNPYQWQTKGELLRRAIQEAGEETVRLGLTKTLSCSKSNPVLPNSGFGRNCGLDYACIVRRAAVRAAGIEDGSNYISNQPNLANSIAALRRDDIEAVRGSLGERPTLLALAARCGPFPNGYDYDRALELWKRGRDELAAIELP